MDLFHLKEESHIKGRRLCLIMLDDFSHFAYFIFCNKSNLDRHFIKVSQILHSKHGKKIKQIRSDNFLTHDFKDTKIERFCNDNDIIHNFTNFCGGPTWKTKRVMKCVLDMTQLLISDNKATSNRRGDAILTACHLVNRVFLKPQTNKTPYELWHGRKPELEYLQVFGSTCIIPGMEEGKNDEGILIGYSTKDKGYKVFNNRTQQDIESPHIKILQVCEFNTGFNSTNHYLSSLNEQEKSDPSSPNQNQSGSQEIETSSENSFSFFMENPELLTSFKSANSQIESVGSKEILSPTDNLLIN